MISVVKGDITKVKTDAIVNAANTSLLGGGGVDGAIHRAGGRRILEECIQIRNARGGCKVGEAVITTGGDLPASYVIHTVGPVWNGGRHNEDALLKQAYESALNLALQHQLTSIAFPNISTGIYSFPKMRAARIAIEAVRNFLQTHNDSMEVILVCFDEENDQIYRKLLNEEKR